MYFYKAYFCILATFQFTVKLEFNLQYQFQATLLFHTNSHYIYFHTTHSNSYPYNNSNANFCCTAVASPA